MSERAIKKTIINFGLVSIGVKLTSLKEQEPLSFHNICPYCKGQINYLKFCKNCNKEIKYNEMLKGYRICKGIGIKVFSKEEIEKLKELEYYKGIEIKAFIPSEDIPFFYIENTYNLLPESEDFTKPFVLFLKAIELSGLSAVGKMIMRNKEYIVMVRAYQGRLFLSTLIYPHRIFLPEKRLSNEITEDELDWALKLVERLKSSFGELHQNGFTKDTVLERFNDLLKGKIVSIRENVKEFKDLQSALIESVKKVDKK